MSDVLFGLKAAEVGLGLRREMLNSVLQQTQTDIDFFEVAPENWLPYGGAYQKKFRQLTERYRFICHGLSLSLGSPDPLDLNFVRQIKAFLKEHQIKLYSEHLSYCSAAGHLYDLLPIPFTEEAAVYVAERIRLVQDVLEQPLVIENVSYYAAPGQELTELEFTNAVLELADCKLLLDVNNIYVNSVNHNYDALAFLKGLPTQRIAYGHVAGHYRQHDSLLIDTHGADVSDPVWTLLSEAYLHHGLFPTLLERDFNIPDLQQLQLELAQIRRLQPAQKTKLRA
ncbi:DUF692 domain-containing protein [Rheinheimera sp. 1928-s]|uniref:HvfB family MNIO-type RiPP peptide maturase n=1 Tax=Rheinheimera sp. 1928-s TaxID=3033803 RepID=UPI002611CC98|nr:DUF692 domain-containing protein [Rheinheimera sp. 1928-s]MDF3126383.1 DUF692 domain-containing protein [Rheinheimera sp. 1928-s]